MYGPNDEMIAVYILISMIGAAVIVKIICSALTRIVCCSLEYSLKSRLAQSGMRADEIERVLLAGGKDAAIAAKKTAKACEAKTPSKPEKPLAGKSDGAWLDYDAPRSYASSRDA
ncbi:MAG: hypothetical protein FJ297_17415 [Planctomycetes bacterium]|nr:hypothetical protein [Planctomycetota bacterium]